jgi:Lrp/AsnC family transcriptional regulator for asnA, asnC and gidA
MEKDGLNGLFCCNQLKKISNTMVHQRINRLLEQVAGIKPIINEKNRL